MAWKEQDDQLIKVFTLENFSAIVQKLPQLGSIADQMDHHPDFEVYGYKNIKFKLTTHSKGELTQLDYQLADEIDKIFS